MLRMWKRPTGHTVDLPLQSTHVFVLRLDCGRVEVRRSMSRNRQLLLQWNASIVNQAPTLLRYIITKSCSPDLHLKVFHVHFVCSAVFLRRHKAVRLLFRLRCFNHEAIFADAQQRLARQSSSLKATVLIVVFTLLLFISQMFRHWRACVSVKRTFSNYIDVACSDKIWDHLQPDEEQFHFW